MPSVVWNPWHGCHKRSAGCANCYVYRRDQSIGKDAAIVYKTASFDLPIRHARDGSFKIPLCADVFACFSSDFFLEDADAWRADAWQFIRARPDCHFLIVTKRIERMHVALPTDWGAGYAHVTIACTTENQDRADARLPIFLRLPIAHKQIICEPLLEHIDLSAYLSPEIACVVAGGESGDNARVCQYEWVLSLRAQCIQAGVPFHFKQTGAHFMKDGRLYCVSRAEQMRQAARAAIDFHP